MTALSRSRTGSHESRTLIGSIRRERSGRRSRHRGRRKGTTNDRGDRIERDRISFMEALATSRGDRARSFRFSANAEHRSKLAGFNRCSSEVFDRA
ncbi:MAG TPA: hypothetical protein DCQ98_05470 [Planctomycetaceae bacterium]|nr:hypothetical protein [Planctomycetaceae bacterium]